jgi:phage tail-like protein
MVLSQRRDPYLTFNFVVEIGGDNLEVGGFSEVSGLQAEIEVEDYREGGLNQYIHKLAGPARYPSNLILKQGLAERETLWAWCQQVLQGQIERRNITIKLLDRAREEKRRWEFARAYPVRWSGPDLRANTAEVAMESLELVHQGLLAVQ